MVLHLGGQWSGANGLGPMVLGANGPYTEQTGLPYFDRAAVTANGKSVLRLSIEPYERKQTFRCRFVNIGLNYKQ